MWASRRWQIAFWAVHVLGACVFVYVWHWHAGSSWAQVVAWWAAYLTGFWAAVLVELFVIPFLKLAAGDHEDVA